MVIGLKQYTVDSRLLIKQKLQIKRGVTIYLNGEPFFLNKQQSRALVLVGFSESSSDID